jgi:regulator of RNase E activity RraA
MNAERLRLVALYEGLRVTDVSDAMDIMGRQDRGNMDYNVRPLWRDVETLKHCFVGFAHTIRFVPTNQPIINGTPEENREAIARWYRDLAPGPKMPVEAGDAIVIDGTDVHVGYIGSNNGFSWILNGAVGIVTNGGCRDTDELIRQKVPVYSHHLEKPIRPFRLEWESEGRTITCGGVQVRPGDVVVADGDGVVVVPIEIAADVAKWARVVANGDRATRRKLYARAGLAEDETVRPLDE